MVLFRDPLKSEEDFEYSDYDGFFNELGDFLSYHQSKQLRKKATAFLKTSSLPSQWTDSTKLQQKLILLDIADKLEATSPQLHHDALLKLFLLLNGLIEGPHSLETLFSAIEGNYLLMMENNIFTVVWEFLLDEIRFLNFEWPSFLEVETRVECLNFCLMILHIILEMTRRGSPSNNPQKMAEIKDHVVDILGGNSQVLMRMWGLLIDSVSGSVKFVPAVKIVILITKSINLVLGEITEYQRKLNQKRESMGLSPQEDDIHLIAERIRSQNSEESKEVPKEEDPDQKLLRQGVLLSLSMNNDKILWRNKISAEKYKKHVAQTVAKHFGVATDVVPGLGRLPPALRKSLSVCAEFIYTPLSDIQRQKMKDYFSRPFSVEFPLDRLSLEWRLFRSIVSCPAHVGVLVDLLLAGVPEGECESPINLMNDIGDPNALNLGTEKGRMREILSKSVSSLLLVLLKYLKLSHIYKFEAICSRLVECNAIFVLLRHISPTLFSNDFSPPNVAMFPLSYCPWWFCPDVSAVLSWRAIYTSINMTRVVIKLVKHKPWRISIVLAAKSFLIQVRMLKFSIPLFQLYTLKMLKLQWKYMTRHWKKNNIRIMSLISLKLRNMINDDWNGTAIPEGGSRENEINDELEEFNRAVSEDRLPHEEPPEECWVSGRDIMGDINQWVRMEVLDRQIDWSFLLN